MAENKQQSPVKKSILPALLFWVLLVIIVTLGVWFYSSRNGSILSPAENTPPPVTAPAETSTQNPTETPPPVTSPKTKTTGATPAPVTAPMETTPAEETPAPVTTPNE